MLTPNSTSGGGLYFEASTPRSLRPGSIAQQQDYAQDIESTTRTQEGDYTQEQDYAQESFPRSLRQGAHAQEQGTRQENPWEKWGGSSDTVIIFN